MGPLTFHPIYQKRVWGGENLQQVLSRTLPEKACIGESWEIVDRSEAMSVVDEGPMAGYTLRELLERQGSHLMGPNYSSHAAFPILVKWLDCQEKLSLQVHPHAAIAAKWGGQAKTEHWYIVSTVPGSGVFAGLKNNVTRHQMEDDLQSGDVERLLQRQPTQPGDSIFVPSGCLHTIDAGNVILEIQQNSDTTYRLYDWGRLGIDGKPRSLHRDAALQSIDFKSPAPEIQHLKPGTQCLADCPAFRIQKFDLHPEKEPLTLPSVEQPHLLHVVEGPVEVVTTTSAQSSPPIKTARFDKGRNALLPFIDSFCLRAVAKKAIVLITDNFYASPLHDQNPATP